jgi:hypothetical protein
MHDFTFLSEILCDGGETAWVTFGADVSEDIIKAAIQFATEQSLRPCDVLSLEILNPEEVA